MRLSAEDPPEFQRDAVELVLVPGRSVNYGRSQSGDHAWHVGNWAKAARDAPKP